jgi:hypothetical protein
VLSEFQKKRYSTPKHYYQTAKQYLFGNLFATKNTIGFDTPNTATILVTLFFIYSTNLRQYKAIFLDVA